MNEILHANIFFIIASVATVVFCIFISLILWQVLKIMKTLRSLLDRIDSSSEKIAQDVNRVRQFVASGSVVSQAAKFFMGGGRSKSRRQSRDDEE